MLAFSLMMLLAADLPVLTIQPMEGLLPPDRTQLWSQPFSYPPALGAPSSSSNDSLIADDLTPSQDWSVQEVRVWGLCIDGLGEAFDVKVFQDAPGGDGPRGGDPQQEISVGMDGVVNTDTGYSQWGFTIWRTQLTLPSPLLLPAGTHCWLAVQETGGNLWYWLGQYYDPGFDQGLYYSDDNGASWTDADGDMSFALLGGIDTQPPQVGGFDPADGADGVSPLTQIHFTITDDCSGVDTSSIVFKVKDDLQPDADGPNLVVGPRPTADISGSLEINDDDPLAVECIFTPDDPLGLSTLITCTVLGDLMDRFNHRLGNDISWSFSVGDAASEEMSWGALKAAY